MLNEFQNRKVLMFLTGVYIRHSLTTCDIDLHVAKESLDVLRGSTILAMSRKSRMMLSRDFMLLLLLDIMREWWWVWREGWALQATWLHDLYPGHTGFESCKGLVQISLQLQTIQQPLAVFAQVHVAQIVHIRYQSDSPYDLCKQTLSRN